MNESAANKKDIVVTDHTLLKSLYYAEKDNQKACIATESPGLLINLLLNIMPGKISTVLSYPYYTNASQNVYMIKIQEIPHEAINDDSIDLHLKRLQSCGNIIYADKSLFGNRQQGTIADLAKMLVPNQIEIERSYENLVFWCDGARIYNNVIDVLFSLTVKNLRVARLKFGNNERYLVRAQGISSPVILSKFGNMEGLTMFYKPLVLSEIWIQWGWRYDFVDASTYEILREKNETIFIFRNGSSEKIKSDSINYIPLIKYMNLKFDMIQVHEAAPRDFNYHIERELKLKKNTLTDWARIEIEDLLQQEQEIRERIEWLKNMESVFTTQVSYKVMYYPFSPHKKDPIFPTYFFRKQHLRQLRQLMFYYGSVGSLGDGVMVTTCSFVEQSKLGRYNIDKKYYPRRGIVFETCKDWMAYSGLRVLIPEGFDLYPYLEVEEEDKTVIVNAFLETVGCTINSRKREDIRANPERYLYFIFPKQTNIISDWEKTDLEAIIIHEKEFRKFDIKIANMGIHFAMNEEDKNIANQIFNNHVTENIKEQFNSVITQLTQYLEDAFQYERRKFKKKIEEFNTYIENQDQNFKESKKAVNDSVGRIKKSEKIITSYEIYLSNFVESYTSKIQSSTKNIENFINEIKAFMQTLNNDIDAINRNNSEELNTKLSLLKEVKKNTSETIEEIIKLQDKRTKSNKSLQEIRDLENKFSDKYKEAKWNRLEIKDNLNKIWEIEKSFEGLKLEIDKISEHMQKIAESSYRSSVYSVSSNKHHEINVWVDGIISHMNEFKTMANNQTIVSHDLTKIINQFREPIDHITEDIKTSLPHLIRREETINQKKIFFKEANKYLKERISSIYELYKNFS
ncbi:MAG: hypothetical protein ABIK92_06610 [Pseudomonadota bacterium]